jgi:hypothetical protein
MTQIYCAVRRNTPAGMPWNFANIFEMLAIRERTLDERHERANIPYDGLRDSTAYGCG